MAPSPPRKPLKGILSNPLPPKAAPTPDYEAMFDELDDATMDAIRAEVEARGGKAPRAASRTPSPKQSYVDRMVRSPPRRINPLKRRRMIVTNLIKDSLLGARGEIEGLYLTALKACDHPTPAQRKQMDTHLDRIESHFEGVEALSKALTKPSIPVEHALLSIPEGTEIFRPKRESVFEKPVTIDKTFAKFMLTSQFGEDDKENKKIHSLIDPLASNHVASRLLMTALLDLYIWANNLKPKKLSATNKIRGMKFDAHLVSLFKSDFEALRKRRSETYMYKKPNGTMGLVEAFASGSMQYSDFPVIVSAHVVRNPTAADEFIQNSMAREIGVVYSYIKGLNKAYRDGLKTPRGGEKPSKVVLPALDLGDGVVPIKGRRRKGT